MMREHSYDEGKEELKELLRQYGNLKVGRSHSFIEEDDFDRIIDYYDEKDDLAEALLAAETGLEQFPYSSQLMIRKADLLLATRNYDVALTVLEIAELYDNANIDLVILKTDAFLALGQQHKAVELLEKALLRFDGEDRLELLFELTDVYDDYEEFDKVFDCLKLILEEEPNSEEALYKICFWTDFTGRNEESIKLHQGIIDEFPYNEIAWFNLAAAYQGLKLYEKAIDAYQYAIVIEEKFDYAYRNMGDAYLRLRQYKEAIEALEKVLELSRPEDVIFEAIGHCYHRMGNYLKARSNYKKAAHLNPDDSRLQYKVAVTYMLEKQWQPAARHLGNAMHIHRNIPEYSLAMGECMLRLKKIKEALQYFGNVVRTRPKKTAGWEALIRCLLEAGYFEEACDQCLLAMEKTVNKPVFTFYYSAALFLAGKQKEALLQLEAGMEKAPKFLKRFLDVNASVLQNPQVVDVLARYKKSRK
ncbi:tetratricopeptide repeat protein [Parasediminibacterium sp. JCM 36343]|uniref:tetratricopeptide repeat protein n=1 Tax=Parasediminibacterium sp. JCM 36343 TaxID=3374279 RepID=UPI00397AEBFC